MSREPIKSLYLQGEVDTMQEIFYFAMSKLGEGLNAVELNCPEPVREDE